MKQKMILCTTFLLCICQGLFAQTLKINGKITDQATGNPLPGVSVYIKGSSKGAVTDADGKFSLNADVGSTLVVSSIGYASIEEKIAAGRTVYNLALASKLGHLNDLVVVGYGQQKKINLTGAVTAVKGEEMSKRQVGNAYLALQGVVPGLTIRQTDGQPGVNGAFVRIRGEGSINAGGSPLVLVDGIEMDFNQIDMSTVESVSVLKDAASAAIYGSRAANGVILITTKRGLNTDNKVRVSYSGYTAMQQPTDLPSPVSAVEYMELINLAKKNNNETPQYTDQQINDYKTLGADNFNRYNTDWKGLVMKPMALMQNHSISITAGNEKLKSMLTAGYFDQDGLIKNNHYTRYTLRANTDYMVNNWLKTAFDISLRNSQYLSPSISDPKSIIRKAINFVPLFSGKNNDNTWGYGQNGDNPIAITEAGGTSFTTAPEVLLNGSLQVNPIKGLSSLTSYSVRYSTARSTSFIKPYDTYESGVYKATYPPDGTQGSEGWSQTLYKLFRTQLNYSTVLARKHDIGMLAGFQSEENKYSGFGASRKNYLFDGYTYLNNGDPLTAYNYGSAQEFAIISFFSRLNYAFAGKYLLELNGRWDASSRFAEGNRWGFFPSASMGWRISEESFMRPFQSVLTNLKIRSSYGLLGNQALPGFYPYASTINLGYSYWFDKQLSSGGAQTGLANRKITWEKSRQFDIGVDADLWNNQLTITFDYYRRYIYDMLQQLPVPYFVGMGAPYVNAGSMENKGWELSIGYHNKIGALKYNITANLSDVRNKVLDLHGKEYLGATIIKEGYAINSYYGYKTAGYFQSQDEINNWPIQFGTKPLDRKNTKPGYVKYLDLNGDTLVNDKDRVVLGNPFPRYEYSLNINLGWNNFDLTVFLQGVGKRQYYISGYGAQPFYVGGTIFKHQTDFWSPTNPNAAYPLLLIDGSGTNPNWKLSDKWLANAAYLRLKLLTLGYTLPKQLTDRWKIGAVRFYVSGQNVLTFSRFYKGYDVENQISGGEFYPIMRTTTLGVDVKF